MENKRRLSKRQRRAVLAIQKHHGILAAAQAVGIPEGTLMAWMPSVPEFEQAVSEVFQGQVDGDVRRQASLYTSTSRASVDVMYRDIVTPATRATSQKLSAACSCTSSHSET